MTGRAVALSAVAGANRGALRRHNLGTVLRAIHLAGPISRAELTDLTGLNRSTIGDLAARLGSLGLVREVGATDRGAPGRPSILLECSPDGASVLAVDITVKRLRMARVGLGGQVLRRHEVPLTDRHRSPGEVGRLLREGADLLRPRDVGSVGVGVGVAVPGIVRPTDGRVHAAPNLGWRDVPLGSLAATALAVPVTVGNDADLGAWAEHLRGAGTHAGNLVFVAADIGVGGGVIVAGSLLRGHRGFAGEIGHIPVNPAGRPCRCGATGCWETEIGLPALARAAQRAGATGLPELLALAGVEPARVRQALQEPTHWLAVGLATLVAAYDPEVIILGGVLPQWWEVSRVEIVDAVAGTLAGRAGPARLCVPVLGADATLMGAAETAFSTLLADPEGCLASHPAELGGTVSVHAAPVLLPSGA